MQIELFNKKYNFVVVSGGEAELLPETNGLPTYSVTRDADDNIALSLINSGGNAKPMGILLKEAQMALESVDLGDF